MVPCDCTVDRNIFTEQLEQLMMFCAPNSSDSSTEREPFSNMRMHQFRPAKWSVKNSLNWKELNFCPIHPTVPTLHLQTCEKFLGLEASLVVLPWTPHIGWAMRKYNQKWWIVFYRVKLSCMLFVYQMFNYHIPTMGWFFCLSLNLWPFGAPWYCGTSSVSRFATCLHIL